MGSQTWNLPAPVDDPDSMLSRKFGRETVNYFAGSVLNRVGWLRTDHTFIRSAFQSKDTKFMLLKDLSPLTSAPTRVQFVSYDDVKPLTTEDPFGPSEEDLIKNFDSTVTKPLIIFLGLEESAKVPFEYKGLKGRPWFAVDVTPKGSYADAANQLIEAQSSKGYKFLEGMRPMTLEPDHAGIYAQARSIADWNTRNKFCAGCGQPSLSGNTGYKRLCPTTDLAGSDTPRERAECATRKGVSNISFPRTDPTMIAAVVSSDGTKVLLGRAKRYPPNWYSTLAGFIEPGESIEESVRREVLEEAGVRVGRVVIHSSQPWPYPASLMIGAVAQALPDGETIDLGNDPELEDAQWFPLETVRDALKFGVSGLGEPAPEGYKEGGLRLPPPAAIANRLMTAVVEGYATAAPKITSSNASVSSSSRGQAPSTSSIHIPPIAPPSKPSTCPGPQTIPPKPRSFKSSQTRCRSLIGRLPAMYHLAKGLYLLATSKEEYSVILLGLDNAGKTTFHEQVKHFFLESHPDPKLKTVPTVGQNVSTISLPDMYLKIWDVGGQHSLRRLWQSYYASAHAIVFIIDSTDIGDGNLEHDNGSGRLDECRLVLEDVLQHSETEGVPVLVLANKQDREDCVEVVRIKEGLVKKVFEGEKASSIRDSRVLPVSALTGTGVKEAVEWVLGVDGVGGSKSRDERVKPRWSLRFFLQSMGLSESVSGWVSFYVFFG
ncbi:putative NUDIX domain-containing protein [Colletotrichum scovillei]|uniref:putative NUDIX domain-containing protein n=1 Tax=Colletotrichum scovillei TaxID=1209932 RepID=UPI0015C3CD53|nr:putative NUDIX domain-containing protein [Colletotrichum scovillei]KAF4782676.1 putative NUDIX domain-containing protein [Colletotrichum scovillei]